jgi:hypothetical protein
LHWNMNHHHHHPFLNWKVRNYKTVNVLFPITHNYAYLLQNYQQTFSVKTKFSVSWK